MLKVSRTQDDQFLITNQNGYRRTADLQQILEELYNKDPTFTAEGVMEKLDELEGEIMQMKKLFRALGED